MWREHRSIFFGTGLLIAGIVGGCDESGGTAASRSSHFEAALRADLRMDLRGALELYRKSIEAKESKAARARYQAGLSERVLSFREPRGDNPEELFNLGVHYSNKFIAVRNDTGQRVEELYRRSKEALAGALKRLPGNNARICLAILYAENGELEQARSMIRALTGDIRPPEMFNLALAHHAIGEDDEALTILESLAASPWAWSAHREWLRKSDDFRRLRGNPRMQRLLALPSTRVPTAAVAIPPAVSKLEARHVQAVMRSKAAEVSRCYKSHEPDRSTPRTLRLSLTIAPDGSTHGARVANPGSWNDSFARCVTEAAERWRFPAFPGEPVEVTSYPFAL
jgi:hypothetical protein